MMRPTPWYPGEKGGLPQSKLRPCAPAISVPTLTPENSVRINTSPGLAARCSRAPSITLPSSWIIRAGCFFEEFVMAALLLSFAHCLQIYGDFKFNKIINSAQIIKSCMFIARLFIE